MWYCLIPFHIGLSHQQKVNTSFSSYTISKDLSPVREQSNAVVCLRFRLPLPCISETPSSERPLSPVTTQTINTCTRGSWTSQQAKKPWWCSGITPDLWSTHLLPFLWLVIHSSSHSFISGGRRSKSCSRCPSLGCLVLDSFCVLVLRLDAHSHIDYIHTHTYI